MSFFDELKRRNVFRVGLAYAVGGWLVVQVADIVLEAIEAPAWVMKAILLLIVLGFVAALFFAWAFEATPDGIKRESEVDRSNSITPVTGRKLDRAIFVMLVMALGYFAWEARIAERAPVQEAADIHEETSVAVLAFKNMSPDPDNAYFAEGISEEILNVLAAVNGLQVASRTSAFSFAGTDTPIPEIAAQLDVAHVLEGSVRRQGPRVRITAQLIDAENDKHLWSKTYDRELTDIFAVQEEIATAISEALLGVLGVEQVAVSAPTTDMAAYELFLRGRQLFYERGDDQLFRGIADLEAAVARDPAFVDAWAFLGAAEWVIPGYAWLEDAEIDEHKRRASVATDRALALDPNNALALAVQAQVTGDSDPLRGLQQMLQALEQAPNDAGILMWAGYDLFMSGGYVDEALPLLERAYRLDPLSGINNGVLGMAYLAAGRRELGYQHMRNGSKFGWYAALSSMVLDMTYRGETDAAIAEVRSWMPEDEASWSAEASAYFNHTVQAIRGELRGGVQKVLTPAERADGAFVLELCALAGDHDLLTETWLAQRRDDASFFHRRLYVPGAQARALMEHPGTMKVAERHGLLRVWEAKGYPFGCVPVDGEQGRRLSCPEWPE